MFRPATTGGIGTCLPRRVSVPPVVPGQPGANVKETSNMATETENTTPAKAESLVDGNVKDVLADIGNDSKTAMRAYKQEKEGKNRSSLLDGLKDVIAGEMQLPQWARKQQVGPNGARFQMAKSTLELFQTTDAYQQVADVIDEGDHRNTGVRLDNDEPTLRSLATALWQAADEVADQSVAEFKTLLRSSRIAASQAQAAANYTPEEPAEPAEPGDEVSDDTADVDADADAIVADAK